MVWLINKNGTEVFDKLKSKWFFCIWFSTYDFSTLYATLPYSLIKKNVYI